MDFANLKLEETISALCQCQKLESYANKSGVSMINCDLEVPTEAESSHVYSHIFQSLI